MDMDQPQKENRRKSIIVSGLIGSAGIFISKFIGLFYAVPFSAILGSDLNSAYYGVAFQIYSYLLNICTAGFPFAIATLVAKYVAKEDYATTLLVKKIASAMMCLFGFGGMVLVILCATPLASLVMPDSDGATIETMRTVLILISFALFFVPMLSSLRGFYQGLKHMEVYALSQVLEQLARVGFLLGFSAIAVYLFHSDQIWAVYFGVLSASVAAIIAILHLKLYDRKQMRSLRRKLEEQSPQPTTKERKKEVMKELCMIALPYLLSALLGYSDSIINTVFINSGMQMHGDDGATIITITGAINYGVLKLIAIPQILAPGFSAAIIPHISEALAKDDFRRVRKSIRECVEIVLFIALPISFCLFAYAKPLYYVMFTTQSLEVSAQVLRWYSIEAFFGAVTPIFSALMMACGLRYRALQYVGLHFVIKMMLTLPLIAWLGYPGTIVSDIIACAALIIGDSYELSKKFQVRWKYTLRRFLCMIIALIPLYGICLLFECFGFGSCTLGRVATLIQLAVSGLLALLGYVAMSAVFQLPQVIFHIRFKKGIHRRKQR